MHRPQLPSEKVSSPYVEEGVCYGIGGCRGFGRRRLAPFLLEFGRNFLDESRIAVWASECGQNWTDLP